MNKFISCTPGAFSWHF
ncbi:unnamed protein product [Acanthoscelides obtectus]|uniref:Uncharacterized protein n=1 Tax=Acanthoscelides obtectus TaxID=200917 RepID=A0A9P0KU33_ACAOB|nr:unnamed protein product [Acanthoscelides obtectus]CAK1674789.1 hypothetical protein AOBTE_LOCUS29741 [Acanthoscelides obtectus]